MNKKALEFNERLARNVKRYLQFGNIGYKQIAPECGMSVGVFSNKITNRARFTAMDLVLMAKYLGVDASVLAGYKKGNNDN